MRPSHDCPCGFCQPPEPSSGLAWLGWILVGLGLLAMGVSVARGQERTFAVVETTDTGTARHAVVRLDNHGGSGTVIATGQGRSLILSAAHMFGPRDRGKKITLDAPDPAPGQPRQANGRCLDVEGSTDLALVEVGVGPMPYVAPVAPAGHELPRQCLSVGYDSLKLPPQMRAATILRSDGRSIYTREMPWHGRSGGALIDESRGWLVGVVSAYTGSGRRPGPEPDVLPGREGVYVSHQAVLAFLKKNGHVPDGTGRLDSYSPAPLAERLIPDLQRPYRTPDDTPRMSPGLVQIEPANRIPNRTGVQCVWASLETLCRHHGVTAGFDLTARHKSTAGPGDVQAALGQRGIRFEQTQPGSPPAGFVSRACNEGLGCLIGVHGRHAIVCVGWDNEKGASVIDNAGPHALQVQQWPVEKFKGSFDGWAVVVYPGGKGPLAQRNQIPPQPKQAPYCPPGGT